MEFYRMENIYFAGQFVDGKWMQKYEQAKYFFMVLNFVSYLKSNYRLKNPSFAVGVVSW